MSTLTDYPSARAAFRGAVLNADFTAYAHEAKRTPLTDLTVEMVYPPAINPNNFYANVRTLDMRRVLSERITAGINAATFPALDEINPDPDEVTYRQGMRRFLDAGGAVASALCLHAGRDTLNRDPAAWRRIDMRSPYPPEAEAALKVAHAEMAAFCRAWMNFMATHHNFLPGYGR